MGNTLKKWMSFALVVTSLITWAVPSYAFRPQAAEEVKHKSGLEEALTGDPREDLKAVGKVLERTAANLGLLPQAAGIDTLAGLEEKPPVLKADGITFAPTTHSFSGVELGRWFKDGVISGDSVKAAQQFLNKAVAKGTLQGAVVRGFGRDLHLQLVHLLGVQSPTARALANQAALAALQQAKAVGLYQTVGDLDVLAAPPAEQVKALRIRVGEVPMTERQQETLFVAKAINAGPGFFNRALHRLFFHPDRVTGSRVESTSFIAVVERVEDVLAGKKDRQAWVFGEPPSTEGFPEQTIRFIRPNGATTIEVPRGKIGTPKEMLTLIADHDKHMITAIYGGRGRFVFDRGKPTPWRYEPIAQVNVDPVSPDVTDHRADPSLMGRTQMGSPALGEWQDNFGGFYFAPGGPNAAYHVGVVPLSLEEAKQPPMREGEAHVSAYAYSSYQNGRIPGGEDFVDVFAQDPSETRTLQNRARRLISKMTQHGEFEPYVVARVAEERAQDTAEELRNWFQPVPKPEERDPLVEAVNARAVLTVTDIKGDAGGKAGHTTTPSRFIPTAQASLTEGIEQGVILGHQVFEVGDDMHFAMVHRQGADANAVHRLGWRSLWRAGWVEVALGFKWYNIFQDLVGPATEGKTAAELAELTERFVYGLLPLHVPDLDGEMLAKVKAAYEEWKRTSAGQVLTPPFGGGISGQGPGFAELPMTRIQPVFLMADDKAGPASFNKLLSEVARGLVGTPTLAKYGKGAVAELWDVRNGRRMFLDFERHLNLIERLVGATDAYNFKRIWARTSDTWEPSEPGQGLGDILLAASTEKLSIITGGEYRGKDDPVFLAIAELFEEAAVQTALRKFMMTQGDGYGSTYMRLKLRDSRKGQGAVATLRSRGVRVARTFLPSGEGGIQLLKDHFGDPALDDIKAEIDNENEEIWTVQGQFTPVGVPTDRVEKSYPLAKTEAHILETFPISAPSSIGAWYAQVSGVSAGLEEKPLGHVGKDDPTIFGVVAVEGAAALVPDGFQDAMAVTMGLKQTKAVLGLGKIPPGRVVAVAVGLEEVTAIENLGVPSVQILQGWNYENLEEAKLAAIRFAQGILETIHGVTVRVVQATALTVQGLLAQLEEQLIPASWQKSVTAETPELIKQLNQLGV